MAGYTGHSKFTLPHELFLKLSKPEDPEDIKAALHHVIGVLKDWSKKHQEEQLQVEHASFGGPTTIVQNISGTLSGGGSGGGGSSATIQLRAGIVNLGAGTSTIVFSTPMPDINYIPDVWVWDPDGNKNSVQVTNITANGFNVYVPVAGTLKYSVVQIT